jgi:outer membrane lipoprotein-sorting protein
MRKIILCAVLFLFVAGLAAASLNAQTVQQVLDKMIEAQGGRAAMEAVKDSTYSGTAELIQFGMSGTFTMYHKEPDFFRLDMEMMGMVITQAYDGNVAWWINPQTGTDELMNEQQTADLKRQALGNDALFNPAKYGITYELKPKEKIGDKEYIVLEQAFKDGFKTTVYLDPDTFLIYKTQAKVMSQTGTEVNSETFMSDYEKEEGLVVAKSINILQDGQEFMRLKISKAVFNSGLADELFRRSGK